MTEVSRTSIPYLTGFRDIYGYRSCLYAIEDGREVKFPMISLLEKYCLPASSPVQVIGGCSIIQEVSDFNNMLNVDYLNMLSTTTLSDDTLVIQENFIVYRRR